VTKQRRASGVSQWGSHQEIAMKEQRSLAFAAAVLLAGVSAASAAGMQARTTNAKMLGAAADSLSLNRIQQKVAWADLSSQATNQNAPSGSNATVGSVVPNSVTIQAVTKKAASDMPALRSYDFAIVQGRLLIVNPSDKKVAEVIRKGSFFA
jgi:hypothetical protein